MLMRKRVAEGLETRSFRPSSNWMRQGETVQAPFQNERRDTPEAVSMSVYQLIAGSLEGPQGLHPETFLAALGALAGYGARWAVRRCVVLGCVADDFHRPEGINRPHVLVSENVNRLVCSMQTQSIASVLTTQMMRSGANWLPDINAAIQHNFQAINSPRYPDYTVPSRHFPAIPPQTLLMMLWEKTSRVLRAMENGPEIAPIAIAMAAAHAVVVHKAKVPVEIGGQLVLETAIAMSKLEYAL